MHLSTNLVDNPKFIEKPLATLSRPCYIKGASSEHDTDHRNGLRGEPGAGAQARSTGNGGERARYLDQAKALREARSARSVPQSWALGAIFFAASAGGVQSLDDESLNESDFRYNTPKPKNWEPTVKAIWASVATTLLYSKTVT